MLKQDAIDLVEKTRDEVKSIVATHLEGGELLLEIMQAFDKLYDDITGDSEPDDDDLADEARAVGFTCLKIDNLADQQKLDDFLRTEIFPTCNLQKANLY